MDELLAMFLLGLDTFSDRVAAVGGEQWGAPTPDTEWTVSDLVEHMVDEHRWAPPLLHGLSLSEAGDVVAGSESLPAGGGVGGDPAAAWAHAAVASREAFLAEGALARSVDLSRGATPVRDYLLEMTFDLAVHSWDLGVAIGYPDPVPAELAGFVYRGISGWGDLSGAGMFGTPVPVSDEAPVIDKLVAATGRALR